MKMGVQAYSSSYVPQRHSEETSMDPARTFCPNMACRKTFSATKGTAFYRLRTSAETVSLVVTLLAHGCPLPAIVVAFGYDERTVAGWVARGGVQGQAG